MTYEQSTNKIVDEINKKLTPKLTKREQFAAMAMQGIIASSQIAFGNTEEIVSASIAYADELIKQLKS